MPRLRDTVAAVTASTAYPVIVLASVAFAAMLLDHHVPPAVAATVVFAAGLAVTTALERASPHVRRWNPPARATVQDALYLALAAATPGVARALVHGAAVLASVVLGSALAARPWLPGARTWMLAVVAVALADSGKYWLHRLAHERAWLWRFHAAHHAPPRMYALNATRLHPVNLLWNQTLDVGVPFVLGLDVRTVTLVAAFRGAVAILQHANIALRLGPLNWVFSTPTLHQWHHASDLAHAHGNYGSTLIVWDVVFGTRRHARAAPAPPALGLAVGSVHPRSFLHQLVWPWCARRAAACRALRGWAPDPATASPPSVVR